MPARDEVWNTNVSELIDTLWQKASMKCRKPQAVPRCDS